MRLELALQEMLAMPFATFAIAAAAMAPASEEQLICSSTAMFRGKVTDAHSADCKLHLDHHTLTCEPENFAVITIEVEHVMPLSESTFSVGDALQAGTRICNIKPVRTRVGLIDICSVNDRDLRVRGDGKAATDNDVARAFVGRSFYFTLLPNGNEVATWVRADHAVAIWTNICPSSPYRRQ